MKNNWMDEVFGDDNAKPALPEYHPLRTDPAEYKAELDAQSASEDWRSLRGEHEALVRTVGLVVMLREAGKTEDKFGANLDDILDHLDKLAEIIMPHIDKMRELGVEGYSMDDGADDE
jgi:hypothetical protein